MSIVRIKKRENPYVQIDKRPLENTSISWKAKGLLAYCLSRPDNWTISVEHLASVSKDGIDAVRSALKELREFGHAELELNRNEETGKMEGKSWVIYEEPIINEPQETTDIGKTPTSGKSEGRKYPTSGKSDPNNKEKGFNKKESSNSATLTTTNFSLENTKDAIVKHLEKNFKTNKALEIIGDRDLTLPEARKKFAGYWTGLERGFETDKDKRWALNSFQLWLEQEVAETEKTEKKNAPTIESVADKVVMVRNIYNSLIPIKVSDVQLAKLETRITKLFKEGETLETIEQQLRKAKQIGSVWRHFDYSLKHFSELKNMQVHGTA